MENNCATCIHKPQWEKQYDDLHSGFCKGLGFDVWMGAATHGEEKEWYEIEFCGVFEPKPTIPD